VKVVAEHRIAVLYPDGQLKPVRIWVGQPHPHPQGDFVCPIGADGLRIWEGSTELFGVGSFHALLVGLGFLYRVLSQEVESGAILRWPDSEQVLDLRELFGPLFPDRHRTDRP
jgi:hypothetical protein